MSLREETSRPPRPGREWLEEVAGSAPVEVGRDPRAMTQDELAALGHAPMSPLRALRRRCLSCCCGAAAEVRRCADTGCPSWPFRMGKNPYRNVSDAQRARGRALAGDRAPRGGGADTVEDFSGDEG